MTPTGKEVPTTVNRITDKRILWIRALFCAYCLLLVWLVLFKLGFQILCRPRGFNFIPFYTESAVSLLWDVALNVLAFVPMGIYLKMMGNRARTVLLAGFATSLAFELLQYAFAMGTADVTDLITNTLGVACGLCLYGLLCRICQSIPRLDRALLIAATVVTGLALVYFFMMLFFQLFMYGFLSLLAHGGVAP